MWFTCQIKEIFKFDDNKYRIIELKLLIPI